MAEQKYYTILTEVGKAKIANATAMGEKVKFTKMQLGDGGGSQYDPQEKQTELKNKVWEGNISNIKLDENNTNWIVVETAIPGSAGGFTVREVGILDDEGELLAIGKYPETYKPVVDDGCVKDLFVRVILMVVNTSTITLKIDPTVILASMKNLEDLRKELNTKIDNTKTDLEKKIEKVQTDLGNIELTGNKVTIEDSDNNFESGTVEGALKELATNDKDLDKRVDDNKTEIDRLKLSVADGKSKIATSVSGKGIPTNGSDSFQQMADNIDSIKTKLPILEGDVGVTEDTEGNVYGVDKIEERQVYYSSRKFSNVWTLSTNNMKIYNLIVDNEGFLYLVGSTGLYKYDKDKNKIWQYLGVNANVIAVDKENNVYVGDNINYKVIKFDSSGNILFEKIMQGKRITSLFVTDGYIYIASADSSSGFNPDLIKIDSQNNETLIYNKVYVNSMYVAKDGSIYIAHGMGLVKLDSNGSLIWEDTSLTHVDCVVMDKEGYVYISTDSQGQIKKYTSDGVVIWTNSGLSYLQDIALDEFGYIYSCCTNSAGIKKHSKYSDLELSGGGSYSKVDVDNFGNIYLLSGTSAETVDRYKDNYGIEKIAVLKEREVQ